MGAGTKSDIKNPLSGHFSNYNTFSGSFVTIFQLKKSNGIKK